MNPVVTAQNASDLAETLMRNRWNFDQARALAAYLIDQAKTQGKPPRFDLLDISREFTAYPSASAALGWPWDDEPDEADEAAAIKGLQKRGHTVLTCQNGSVIVHEV